MPKFSAQKIVDALKLKHAEDIFFSECKTGASYGRACPRMDGWVMKKSWAQQCFTGYEIKVDRSDFMNDDKWQSYLPYCNEFYFVCPTGLIKPDEVGLEAGLMYLSKTGTRLFRKKKAPHHPTDPDKLASLFQYVMMWRMSQKTPSNSPRTSQKEYWEQWMRDKEIDRNFGYNVGKSIQIAIKDKIHKVHKENEKLQSLITRCDLVREFLKQYDINVDKAPVYSIKNQLAAIYEVIPQRLIDSISSVEQYLSRCRRELVDLKEKSKNDVQV